MKVIICGAGRVGSSIAQQLSSEQNDITVIDQDKDALDRISQSMDLKTVQGFACHPPVLANAGASEADMIIAVTTSDEVNMIACQIGKTIFKIQTKIARIRHQAYLDPVYQDMYRAEDMPVDVIISPEIEVAKNILNRFHVPGATESIPIENSSVKIVGVRVSSECLVCSMTVDELKMQFKGLNVNLLGISRDKEFLLPSDRKLTLESNDEVFLVADSKVIPEAMEILGHEEEEARRIVIIGGGNIGLFLAKELETEHRDARVKIIELSQERAEKIAEQLGKTLVINGDALDETILNEVSISRAEIVISVSNDDEVNILSSLLAKNMGAKISFTLLNNHSFVPLMQNLGIDVTINPRETTVSSILQHVRRGKIRSAHTLKEGKAEVLETEISESINMAGKKLQEINIPDDAYVGAIIRESAYIEPTPETVLKRRDRLVIMALSNDVKAVEDLFSMQHRFF